MKATILLAVLIGVSSCLFAQSSAIHGKVYDELGEPVYAANISIIDGPTQTGATTDFDGRFKIKPLNAGTYTVEVSYLGYSTSRIEGVYVSNNKITFLEDINLEQSAIIGKEVIIVEYKEKLIDPDEPSKVAIGGDKILKTPGPKNAAMLARSYSSDIQVVGSQMVIRGSRPGSSSVYIDGMKVTNEMSGLPSLAIGSMEIYTGGIPAKYGDVTGGVIMMSTKSYFDLVNERRSR